MRRLTFSVLPMLALGLIGCGHSVASRPLRAHFYTSIISLSPSTTEIVFGQTDSGRFVKGRTKADDWPSYGLAQVPVVASVKPDYEAIAKVNPDLILYDSALYSPADVEQIKSHSPKAKLMVISADTLADFEKQLYELGSLIGGETRVNDYVTKIQGAVDQAMGDAPATKPKVAVILPSPGGDLIAGSQGFLADVIRHSGGEPVGPDSKIFVSTNGEAVVAMNPDVIIVPGTKSDLKGAIAVFNNPAYKTIKAVQNRQVKAIDEDVLLRRGGRVDVLIDALARVLRGGK